MVTREGGDKGGHGRMRTRQGRRARHNSNAGGHEDMAWRRCGKDAVQTLKRKKRTVEKKKERSEKMNMISCV